MIFVSRDTPLPILDTNQILIGKRGIIANGESFSPVHATQRIMSQRMDNRLVKKRRGVHV